MINSPLTDAARSKRTTLTRLPLAIFLATLLAYGFRAYDAQHWIESDGRIVGRDFLAFFMAGEFARAGNIEALYDLETQEAWQRKFMRDINPNWSGTCLYLNPPHYAGLTSFITQWGYGTALAIWSMGALLCFAATASIWRRWLMRYSHTRDTWREVVLLIICLPAFFQALAGGQNSFISLLILIVFCELLLTRRDGLAGIVLALLAYKFQLMLLPAALLVVRGRFRALAGLLLGICATVALTVWTMGVASLVSYVNFARGLGELLQLDGFDVDKQHSWHGFFTLIGSGWLATESIRILTATASLVTLAIVARIWHGPWTRRRLPLVLAATMIANLLISPHLFHYDMLLVALPAVLWLVAAREMPGIVTTTAIKPILLAGYLWLCVSPIFVELLPIQLSPGLLIVWLVVALRASRNYAAAQTTENHGAQSGDNHGDAPWRLDPA